MLPVYSNPAELEKLVKEKYAVPQFLMMENAANAMAAFILEKVPELPRGKAPASVVIACGKGNNGGDGYALARLLQDKLCITLLSIEPPAAQEALAQQKMYLKLGLKALSASTGKDLKLFEKKCLDADFVVDCIYGTGFHGELKPETSAIIKLMNKSHGIKIACDIPSALEFSADYTITMGENKLALFSDKAKAVCGKLIVPELGISRQKFEAAGNSRVKPTAWLIEESDIKLPLRINRAAHKGTCGHTSVLCGDKAGAAIIAATAAMNFGSGLTSLVQMPAIADSLPHGTPLSQFKISPSLMIADSIPKKTTCIAAGSGFSEFSESAAELLISWIKKCSSPAVVLDAGMLTSPKTPELLKSLNCFENAKIILTPHPGELSSLLKNCRAKGDISVAALANSPETKIAAGLFLNKLFPRTTVIMKSANTFIACEGKIYLIADGAPSLAKGGSGDLLAGLTSALLAQGYSTKDAAITATGYHASLSKKLGEQAYNLTPDKFLKKIF